MKLIGPPSDSASSSDAAFPARIAAVRDNVIIMLMPIEVWYAQSDGNIVWFQTDQGRLKASLSGFSNVVRHLLPLGFLRIHRQYVVNLARIRQVFRSTTGTLMLTTGEEGAEAIPVARRNEGAVRRVLGI
jgi:sigma-54 dependent transcriptional regulator, acetoin dehydrogenase operon transcriptional activator AcoR